MTIYYALDRDTDVSGISGTGRVAYAIVLPQGDVLMMWDTEFEVDGQRRPSHGVEWLPDLDMLRTIHCYGGRTRLTPLDGEDPEGLRRLVDLLIDVQPRFTAAAIALTGLLIILTEKDGQL